jgi:hypothetical protein
MYARRMSSRLRVRFLLAVSIPLASCAKPQPQNDPAAGEAPSQSVTNTAPPVPIPSPREASLPAADVSAPSAPFPDTLVDATPARLLKPPSNWSITYKNPSLLSRWCPVGTAQCFPRANVPTHWGKVTPEPAGPSTKESQMGCPGAIAVACGCTPGGTCSNRNAPCEVPLVTGISQVQSGVYAGGACCYDVTPACANPASGGAPSVHQ